MALLSMGPQPKDVSFGRTVRTHPCHRNCCSPRGNQQNLSSRGYGRKQAGCWWSAQSVDPGTKAPWAPRVSPQPTGAPAAWLLAPGSRLPAAVAQRLCSGPRATLSQDAWACSAVLGVVERSSRASEGSRVSAACDGSERQIRSSSPSRPQSLMV